MSWRPSFFPFGKGRRVPLRSFWGKPPPSRCFHHLLCRHPRLHTVLSDWAVVMVTWMYRGWMGEPLPTLPTSSRAIIKCNLEQTTALISLDQGRAQVVDIAGTSPSQADILTYVLKTWLQPWFSFPFPPSSVLACARWVILTNKFRDLI